MRLLRAAKPGLCEAAGADLRASPVGLGPNARDGGPRAGVAGLR
jgi:hypothetical protein